LFGIVGTLVAMDIVFLIPVTAVPGARLRREYEEIEGENVSTFTLLTAKNVVISCIIVLLLNVLHDRLMIYLR